MANTLTNLYPDIFTALNVVSRERIGFIPAISRDAKADRAAENQTVRASVVPAMTSSNVTPSNTSSTGTDRNVSTVDVTISNIKKVDFHITGEEQQGIGDENNLTVRQQSFAQAFRTLSNEIEADIAALYKNASRAYGTAGTTPFGSGDDLTDLTRAMEILDKNGAPATDRSIILDTIAGATLLGKQPALFRVNEAGSELERRQARFQEMFGAKIGISNAVKEHTKGTGSGFLVNNGAGYSVGDTTITLDTGTGTILAGDVVTFAGDANKYVNKTALASNDIVLQEIGLLEALADNTALTVGDTYRANMAFSRDALLLASRLPYLPDEGDEADDRMMVQDPVSGLVFEISLYKQYRQVTYEVAIAWGVKAVKPEHLAILLG